MAEQIEPEQKTFVISTIRRFFPDVEILAYGSRIKGSASKYSDLDVALRGKTQLDWRALSDLKEAFANSEIPIKVAVVDFATFSDDFKKIVEKTCVKW